MFTDSLIIAKNGMPVMNGDSIQDENRIGYVYRFENGKKRQFMSNEIADSWDKNWKNAKTVKTMDFAMIPMGVPMTSKPTGFVAQVIATQNAVAPNPLTSPPLNPPVVVTPVVVTETTPRTVNPNPTTPSVAKEVETVVVEEKLLGVKKPMAYYVYGGGLLLLIVVAYFIFKNK